MSADVGSPEVTHALGHILRVPDGERPEDGVRVHVVGDVNISADDAGRFQEAISAFGSVQKRGAFAVLARNFREVIGLRDFYSRAEKLGRQIAPEHFDLGGNITRVLTNWLASARAYLVSTENELMIRFAKDSEEHRTFIDATRAAYDASPSYRLMYKLRDYSQHLQPPVSSLRISADHDNNRTRLEVLVKKEDLLGAHFNWTPKVRQEIGEGPDEISLLPHVEQAMDDLYTIEEAVLGVLVQACLPAIPVIEEALDRLGGKPGALALLAFSRRTDVEGLQWQSSVFPTRADLVTVRRTCDERTPMVVRLEPTRDPRPDAQLIASSRASYVARATLEGQGHAEVQRRINEIRENDETLEFLVAGLLNQNLELIHLVAQALGTTTLAVHALITPEDDDLDGTN